jgi:hypothetical protein
MKQPLFSISDLTAKYFKFQKCPTSTTDKTENDENEKSYRTMVSSVPLKRAKRLAVGTRVE